jgi:hypothetical protein
MDVRQLVLDAFPNTRKHEFKLYHLASVLWKPHVADKLRNIGEWQQLLDMPVDKIGPTGIGALMNFMDADMLVAYLPAWLVIAYEHDWRYAGVLPTLVGCLAYEYKLQRNEMRNKDAHVRDQVCEQMEDEENIEEQERFSGIKSSLSAIQMEVVAVTLNELAAIHLQGDQEVKGYLQGVANFWWRAAKEKHEAA